MMPNTLYHADCMDILPTIPDKSIDMIFTDLPYGTTQNQWDKPIPLTDYVQAGEKIYYEADLFQLCIDLNLPIQEGLKYYRENKKPGLWTHYERVIKDNGCIALWAQAPYDKILACSNQKLFRYEWIIEKTKATGHLNAKKMSMKAHESVLIFYKKLPPYHPQMSEGHTPVHAYTKHTTDGNNYGATKTGISGGGSTQRYPRDVLKFSWDTQTSRIHPTQKPVAACEYFIRTYTNPGDVILDTCAGSMTTAIAAVRTGRRYICIEKDKDIYEKGKARIGTQEEQILCTGRRKN